MQYLKKIARPLISGWIGHGNFGDELMAEILRQYLTKRFGTKQFTYYKVGSLWSSVVSVYGTDINFLHKEKQSRISEFLRNYLFLRKYDSLFFGGGSIFHSNNSILWKHRLLKDFKRYSPHAPTAAIGISLGPFKSSSGEEMCAQFLEDLDFVVFRDQWSVEFAQRMKVSTPVYECSDIALLSSRVTPELWVPAATKDGVVGFMLLSRTPPMTDTPVFQALLQAINTVINKRKQVRLFTFYSGEGYFDNELNCLLRDNCDNSDSIEIVTFTGDMIPFLHDISECERIISMRFHGLVTAYLFSVPFMSITYHPKNDYFLNDLEYPNWLRVKQETMTVDNVAQMVERLLSVDVEEWRARYRGNDAVERSLQVLNDAFHLIS
jgi:polysaccharide pyruvyl transferase WcaK-like protein